MNQIETGPVIFLYVTIKHLVQRSISWRERGQRREEEILTLVLFEF